MRLTLRTLLAYLDDVLDPADKEELGKKIESSEFAEDLVHRTRDTMRRLRLSAPQVVGAGMGLDPNTVAEYLDNALPPDSMGDFERICLESDMHLAEVASCHHVLTMVLGQPADVDPAAKQRMYSIPTEAAERKRLRVEAAHSHAAVAATAAAPGASLVPASSVAMAPRPAASQAMEIPEYLRTTGWTRYRGLLLGLAALLLVGATVYFMGGFNRWFGAPPNTALVSDGPSADRAAPNTFEQSATTPEKLTQPSVQPPAAVATTSETASPPQTLQLAPPVQNDASATAAIAPATGGPEGGGTNPDSVAGAPAVVDNTAGISAEVTPVMPAPAVEATDPNAAQPPPDAPAVVEQPAAATEIASDTSELPSEPAANLGDPSDVATTLPAIPRDPLAPGDEPPIEVGPDGNVIGKMDSATGAPDLSPEIGVTDVEAGTPLVTELGTYLGGKTVLLRHDGVSGGWFRVTPRSAVAVGELLLALPEFRPKITLAAGLNLDIIGGTLVTMGTASEAASGNVTAVAANMPAIDVIYGRIVLMNTSIDEQRQIRLIMGPTTGDAMLAPNATMAVEVERQYVPGLDPRKAASPVVVRLYVPEGGVVWRDVNGETMINRPSEWTIADGAATEIVDIKSLPEWIDEGAATETSKPLYQRYAIPMIEGALVSERPAGVQLLELFQGTKRREEKSLLARSAIHVRMFEPFVEALRDSNQKPNWATHITSLRSAMALGPASADEIWQTLVKQRGETEAADLYEMLCGYSADQVGRTPDQWKTGAIKRLIDWLEDENLDYRVLASHNLREITGKEYMSNPAGKPRERAQNVRTWRARLDSGDLKPLGGE